MSCCGKSRRPSAARPRTLEGERIAHLPYSLISRDGSTQSFGSRLEADAENARQGYTGRVRQAGS